MQVDHRYENFFGPLKCKEHMIRVKSNSFEKHVEKIVLIAVLDLDSGPGAHVNFDNFRGDFVCLGKTVNL